MKIFRMFVLAAIAMSAMTRAAAAAEDAAMLSFYEGTTQVRFNDETDWGAAEKNMALQEGDSIKTGANGKARIVLEDESTITIGPLSVFTIKTVKSNSETGSKNALFELSSGSARGKVSKLSTEDSSFEVETPTAVAGVRGTDFMIENSEDGEESVVTVLEGEVEVGSRLENIKERIRLRKEESSTVRGRRPPDAPRKADPERMERARERLSRGGPDDGAKEDRQAAAIVAARRSDMSDEKKREVEKGIRNGDMTPDQAREKIKERAKEKREEREKRNERGDRQDRKDRNKPEKGDNKDRPERNKPENRSDRDRPGKGGGGKQRR